MDRWITGLQFWIYSFCILYILTDFIDTVSTRLYFPDVSLENPGSIDHLFEAILLHFSNQIM